MGYGEYIGGGSVVWRVKHGGPAKSKGKADKRGGRGRDDYGKGSTFKIYVNGALLAEADCDTGRVLVVWDDPLDADTGNKPNKQAIAALEKDADLP